MKSKSIAYLLLIFGGAVGAHKFYLNKIGTGILYCCTGGLFDIGWLIDLFTLGGQVDTYNTLNTNNFYQSPNFVVNIGSYTNAHNDNANNISDKMSAEKQILILSNNQSILSMNQILAQTHLEFEEAEQALKNLLNKGLAKEIIEQNGKLKYDFR